MPTYITLSNLTDQGIRNMKDLSRRLQNAEQTFEQMGAQLREVYMVMGQYDYIVMNEDLERTVEEVERIIEAERRRASRSELKRSGR